MAHESSSSNQEKEAAARASLRFVHDGQIVGLGTGSTAAYAVCFLGERVRAGLKIRGIPTSVHTKELATSLGIPLTTLEEIQQIDVTIDGADEVDPQLNLIKGGGGALLREKIIASATRQLVIIGDSGKKVPMLGSFRCRSKSFPSPSPCWPRESRRWEQRLNSAKTPTAIPSSPTKAITFWIVDLARFPIRPDSRAN